MDPHNHKNVAYAIKQNRQVHKFIPLSESGLSNPTGTFKVGKKVVQRKRP